MRKSLSKKRQDFFTRNMSRKERLELVELVEVVVKEVEVVELVVVEEVDGRRGVMQHYNYLT